MMFITIQKYTKSKQNSQLIGKRYKPNSIKGDSHHCKEIATNFPKGLASGCKNLLKVDYPIKL